MAQKLMLKDIGMDSMEILYYERQAKRKKAYAAKKRKISKRLHSDTSSIVLKKAI